MILDLFDVRRGIACLTDDAFDHRHELHAVGGIRELVVRNVPFQPSEGATGELVDLVIQVGPFSHDPAGTGELGLFCFRVVAKIDRLGLRS